MESTTSAPAYKAGLYWRKSRLVAANCPPGILALEGGRLRYTAERSVVFDVPVAEATATLTGWGTLTITAAGTRYPLMATAGELSRPFSDAQKAELSRLKVQASPGKIVSGVTALGDWPRLLRDGGASVTARKPVYARWFMGITLAILAVGVVIAIVVNNAA